MSDHLDEVAVMRLADGEEAGNAHVRECARCANAVVAALQMKKAVREAVPRYELPASVAARFSAPSRPGGLKPAATQLLAIAASLAIVLGLGFFAMRRENARELVDLHTTIVGSTNPIDVVSTDRHTVKPWFEGKVPFAVSVPELNGTPFHLAGGRVVFWRGRPVAYLLVTKGAHRISVFAAEEMPQIGGTSSMTIESWRANGLDYVAVGDVPRSDLAALRRAFSAS
ncbi:MAG TPA: hypothetical protein VLU46_06425 [Thermoanaerobaculia bacterium]|nr:hypothetical protein [Thermoanaerobaculia bacterium]